MRKLIVVLFSLVATLALVAVGSPADAEHAPEGTITVAGVETCSNDADEPGDGKCTWTTVEPNGWVGFGPFTITDDGGTTYVDCAAGEFCQSEGETDPIPAGVTVTSDGSGGGTFAAGDPDEGE